MILCPRQATHSGGRLPLGSGATCRIAHRNLLSPPHREQAGGQQPGDPERGGLTLAPLLHHQPADHASTAGQHGVEERGRGEAVGRQRRSGVEPEPAGWMMRAGGISPAIASAKCLDGIPLDKAICRKQDDLQGRYRD